MDPRTATPTARFGKTAATTAPERSSRAVITAHRRRADGRPVVKALCHGLTSERVARCQAGGAKNSSAIPSGSRKETPEP